MTHSCLCPECLDRIKHQIKQEFDSLLTAYVQKQSKDAEDLYDLINSQRYADGDL